MHSVSSGHSLSAAAVLLPRTQGAGGGGSRDLVGSKRDWDAISTSADKTHNLTTRQVQLGKNATIPEAPCAAHCEPMLPEVVRTTRGVLRGAFAARLFSGELSACK
ncbi:unnamed protein product [Prorocentrum cordatum]|uniref:Secreted protein n=1 Tax=Prorocentrum cordatum TaxID=2364126 RepID=A0ABN9UT14_9DINO|nr:unnamed protein product [Polarella glacialis]